MIYTINNCIRAFGYTSFDKLIEDKGSIDGLKEYVRANGYADIAVAEDTELLLVDVNGKTWHTGCYGAKLNEYLCFTSTGDSTIKVVGKKYTLGSSTYINFITVDYKINNGEWKKLTPNRSYESESVTLHDGDKMYIKSDYWQPNPDLPTSAYTKFAMTGSIAASGNIMSLCAFNDKLTKKYQFVNLFKDCSALTQAPDLPVTTLTQGCYSKMFSGCSKLNYVKALFTDISAQDCLTDWLSGVSATGTFVKNPEATYTKTQAGIPSGWTVQTEV